MIESPLFNMYTKDALRHQNKSRTCKDSIDTCKHIYLIRNYVFNKRYGNIVPIVDVCKHCNYILE